MHKIFLGALNFLNHWRDLHKFFGTVRQKQSTESWYPNYPTNFETRAILKHKRVHPRWLLAMWDKKMTKLWYPYYLKTFDTKTILKHRRVRARCFSAIWDKKTSTEKRDTPLFIHKLFPYYKFSVRQKRSPTNFFGTVRLEHFHGTSWDSPIMHKNFGCPNFLNHWRVLHKFFGTVRQKQNNRQNRDTPIIQQTLKPEQFWNTDGFAHDDFWRCETKNFHKIVIPLLSKNFWYQNVSERQKGSPTTIFGDVKQKSSAKLWYPYYRKTFDTRTFLKDRRVRPRCSSVIWDKKKFDGKTWHSLLIHIFFRTRKFLNHKSVPHEVFRYRETKTFPRNVAELLFYA